MSVYYQFNNTTQEQLWGTLSSLTDVTVSLTADAPKQGVMLLTGANGMGAFGRFQVTADQPGATVRIIACGRSS